jgi:hypothetical protein
VVLLNKPDRVEYGINQQVFLEAVVSENIRKICSFPICERQRKRFSDCWY